MRSEKTVDPTDARILAALNDDPRAPVMSIATRTGLSRNTVQARLARLDEKGLLHPFEYRVDPAGLGYGLTAFILTEVTQRRLTDVSVALEAIPEVLEVHGLSGVADLLVHVVARDADDLYRVAGRILEIDGVEKTTTSLVMRKLVEYRTRQLFEE